MKTAGVAKKKILVGISGGMNSAVAAALLQSQGYQVQGVFIQVLAPEHKGAAQAGPRFEARCCLTKKVEQAKEVSRKLDIPLQIVHAEGQFEDQVVDGFVHDLLQGRFPNPCVPCHLKIRLETLLEKADEMGCEQVATGHHAQVLRDAVGTGGNTSARLQRAVDVARDQSYFLYGLTQAQLSRLLFPLGGFQQIMIARLSREFGLPEDSGGNPQAVCLSAGDSHIAFFEAKVPVTLRPGGNIKMLDGSVMGEHRGLHVYRIGQRKIKLAPHVKDSEKYLVTDLDVPGHALLIGSERDLYRSKLVATHASWIRPVDGLRGLKTSARFSPSQVEAVPCRVTHFENGVLRVELEEPCLGVLVGAPVVFYDGDEILGGARVSSTTGPSGTSKEN